MYYKLVLFVVRKNGTCLFFPPAGGVAFIPTSERGGLSPRSRNLSFNFRLLKYKTLANFLRIVKVGVTVALALLARYNVQM